MNTGAFDPFDAICAHARGSGAWVHVDGAFGLWAAAPARRCAHLAAGIDRRRLVGHRRAQVAQRAVRQRARVRARRAMRCAPPWRSRPTTCRPRRRSATRPTTRPSCRAARAASTSGPRCARSAASGVAELVERCCRHARRFAAELLAAGYEVLNDVVLNQVLVAFGDAETTQRVDRRRAGRRHLLVRRRPCGRGAAAMRISVSSWATTDDDVMRSVQAIVRIAARGP